MIDFERSTALANTRSFLRRFRGEAVIAPEAFQRLGDFLLSHTDGEEELVGELCAWSDRELESFLTACWQSDSPEALSFAGTLLTRRGSTGLVYWIENLLREPGGARRLADVLGEVHDDDSTRILIGLLDHPEFSLRRRAADGLASHRGSLDGRAFVRHLALSLVKGLAHPEPHAAVRALCRLADPALEPQFGKDAARRAERVLIQCVRHERRSSVRGDAIAALGEIGSRAAVRCLVDMLSREDQIFHRDVVISLRKIHPDRALIALLGLLQSPDPIIREESANALGAIGDPQAVKRLRELLDDENADVRQEAVLALGKLGGRDVLMALEQALQDSDPAVRTIACSALAQNLGPRAQGKLIRALYDDAADVRSEAAYLLGNVGDENARAHLEVRLGDRERDSFGDSVASTARKSLHQLDGLRRKGA